MIDIVEKDDRLLFTIKDNGIGSEQAAKLRTHTRSLHQSLGLTVTSERINALTNDNTKTPSTVEIHDLVDPSGRAEGTEVHLNLNLTLRAGN